jgi:predicted ATPase
VTSKSIVTQTWAVSEESLRIVETIRAFVDGTLAPGGAMALAPRVEELIRSRFDRLGETARTLLPVLAVIGREADFGAIHYASQLSEPEAATGLEELVRRQVVRAEGERFAFSHDRVREVVPPDPLSRLRLLHARVGEALERVHAANLEPHYEALGLHYRAGKVCDKAAYLA